MVLDTKFVAKDAGESLEAMFLVEFDDLEWENCEILDVRCK